MIKTLAMDEQMSQALCLWSDLEREVLDLEAGHGSAAKAKRLFSEAAREMGKAHSQERAALFALAERGEAAELRNGTEEHSQSAQPSVSIFLRSR